jgi:hypothetical protein
VKKHAGHGLARGDFFPRIGHEPGIDQAHHAAVLADCRQHPSMIQALDAERCHLAPPLHQMRVCGHSAEDKWFLPLLHLLNAGLWYGDEDDPSRGGFSLREDHVDPQALG